MRNLRHAMGVPLATDLDDRMTGFVAGIGLPTTLSTLGVQQAVLPSIAEKSARDHLSATNPRPGDARDYLQLLSDAM